MLTSTCRPKNNMLESPTSQSSHQIVGTINRNISNTYGREAKPCATETVKTTSPRARRYSDSNVIPYFRKDTKREIYIASIRSHVPDTPLISPRQPYSSTEPETTQRDTTVLASVTNTSFSSNGSLSDSDCSSESETTDESDYDSDETPCMTANSRTTLSQRVVPIEDLRLFEDIKRMFPKFNGNISWTEVHVAINMEEPKTFASKALANEILGSAEQSAEFILKNRKSATILFDENLHASKFNMKEKTVVSLCATHKKTGDGFEGVVADYYKHCFRIRARAVITAAIFVIENLTTRAAVDNMVTCFVRVVDCHAITVSECCSCVTTNFRVKCTITEKKKLR